jgi:hypothetical protein
MSIIVAFYQNENVHPLKYTLEEMWTWDDRKIESLHSFIQWMFPLKEPSANSLDAPILTKEDIEQFKTDPEIRARLMKSFLMMIHYYGFAFSDDNTSIVKGPDFETRSGWLYPSNHNYLRITRILKCLVLSNFQNEAVMFYKALEEIYKTHGRYIGPTSYRYWCNAVGLHNRDRKL